MTKSPARELIKCRYIIVYKSLTMATHESRVLLAEVLNPVKNETCDSLRYANLTHELIMYFSQKLKVSFSGNLKVLYHQVAS